MRLHWYTVKRWCRFWWQRRTRGWDDSDLWSLDQTIAKFIAPRLRRFAEHHVGYHGDSDAEWTAKLDKMVEAFEWYAGEERWNDQRNADKYDDALKLFAEHFGGLWD